ncbi:hypothetical protein A33M_0206 [Rhodovulum sp. PH10]|uniref:hypothetical protein n=1 Tax=Rhodovulum sp. PH10 TaxID=1187851 RepID=UPI00027C2241|nr:hypothetical protein [Rhodovulum sp. PH10]EJW10269.1 hypothetical protein A33M_0206 [Rhodovulum sp. PH10]
MHASRVVFSFFRYRRSHAYASFLLMGFQRAVGGRTGPAGHLRLMGCGSGNGFSIVPDFSRYCVMSLPAEPDGFDALKRTRLWRWAAGPSIEAVHVVLRPATGHGTWNGDPMFAYSGRRMGDGPFAVLTNARVAPGRARAFWRRVPEVDRSLGEAEGCLWHIGVGDHPLLQLATFSIWENFGAMRAFAYRHGRHPVVARESQKDAWLPESMFVRFEIEAIEGDLSNYPRLAQIAENLAADSAVERVAV